MRQCTSKIASLVARDHRPSFIEHEGKTDYSTLPNRQLYYYLLNIEFFGSILQLTWEKLINSFSMPTDKQSIFSKNSTLKPLNELLFLREALQKKFIAPLEKSIEKDALHYLINQYSPLALIDGALLSTSVSLQNSRYEYGGHILKMHFGKVGGSLSKNHVLSYAQMARDISLNFLPIFSWGYAFDDNRTNESFILPVFLLSLKQFPTILLPEILGANALLSLFDVPLFSEYITTSSLILSQNYIQLKKDSHLQYRETSFLTISQYLTFMSSSHPNEIDSLRHRINCGFFTAYKMIQQFYNTLSKNLCMTSHFSVETKIHCIFERIGTKASGYHKKGVIGDKKIDDWFSSKYFCPKKLLSALASSRYIKPGDPERSPFIHQITSPTGYMFRIFSDDEVALFKLWIKMLATKNNTCCGSKESEKYPLPNTDIAIPFPAPSFLKDLKFSEKKYRRCTLKDLYHYLMFADRYPDILPIAKKFVMQSLRKKRKNLFAGNLPIPFKHYAHEKLDRWLAKKHIQQVESYQALEGEPDETKQKLIETTVQLSPLTYIDGAWVRQMTDPTLVNTSVGTLLYNIYVDELGNGDIEIHHGNIFRRLIAQMKIELPDFESINFSHHPYFDENCLRLPVFWLAIACFSKTFLPEILGLNLAMELAGIGGSYRRSGDILRYYGFSSQFTNIHNSIDNIVSGHTAWSIQAIKLHIDEVKQSGGNIAVRESWYRIWTGYRSLTPENPKKIWTQFSKIASPLYFRRQSEVING